MKAPRLLPVLGLFLAPLLPGCGGKESANVVHVRGTVSYQGKPLPRGMIVFDPDAAQGNRGPQGQAEIRDGNFDTRSSKHGAVAGPVIVRIVGGDGVAPEPVAPFGKLLFEEYTTRLTLSGEAPTLTLNVPALGSGP